jgi:hypothetical protein
VGGLGFPALSDSRTAMPTINAPIPDLRDRRLAAGLSQLGPAVKAGVSLNTAYQADHGLRVRPETRAKLEAALAAAEQGEASAA